MTAASIRCPCGRVYSRPAWRALPAVTTLTGGDVHAYVSVWPSDCQVEVRACGGCGRRMARTARAESESSAG